ncbi:MAG TPA: spore cortex-lytic enzyme [Candidatus Excrementavichristensenella intestinipullorum]|nr:spore cortex-lytic enzyme [Candidatus Excrementavichristensenella intestinipullorum]
MLRRLRRGAALACALVLAAALVLPAQAAVVLDIGSRGENVRKVQQRLIQWGYMTGSADGVYGAQTQAAVKQFQRKYGLTADGRVGPATAAKMGITLTSSGSGASSSATTASIVSSDHRLLSKLVYAEARGEPYKGQVAVAAVVLNRVKSSSFPNTISGVIYQKGAFSCVTDGQINLTPDDTAIRAARDAMNGWDPTGGCLYYYNPKTASDQWIRTRTVKTVIGNHSFAV